MTATYDHMTIATDRHYIQPSQLTIPIVMMIFPGLIRAVDTFKRLYGWQYLVGHSALYSFMGFFFFRKSPAVSLPPGTISCVLTLFAPRSSFREGTQRFWHPTLTARLLDLFDHTSFDLLVCLAISIITLLLGGLKNVVTSMTGWHNIQPVFWGITLVMVIFPSRISTTNAMKRFYVRQFSEPNSSIDSTARFYPLRKFGTSFLMRSKNLERIGSAPYFCFFTKSLAMGLVPGTDNLATIFRIFIPFADQGSPFRMVSVPFRGDLRPTFLASIFPSISTMFTWGEIGKRLRDATLLTRFFNFFAHAVSTETPRVEPGVRSQKGNLAQRAASFVLSRKHPGGFTGCQQDARAKIGDQDLSWLRDGEFGDKKNEVETNVESVGSPVIELNNGLRFGVNGTKHGSYPFLNEPPCYNFHSSCCGTLTAGVRPGSACQRAIGPLGLTNLLGGFLRLHLLGWLHFILRKRHKFQIRTNCEQDFIVQRATVVFGTLLNCFVQFFIREAKVCCNHSYSLALLRCYVNPQIRKVSYG
jgi:hypothetical protein